MLKLECLLLASNDIGDDGAAALADSLMGLPCLIKINLSRNELTGTALCSFKSTLVALGSVGRQQVTNLEVFDLSGNDLGGLRSAGSAQALTSCLEHMPRLQSLNLGSNNIFDSGAKQLAIALQNMPSLRTLQLNDNSFSNGGATDLIGSLVGLTSLTNVEMCENGFTDDVRDVLEAALKRAGRTVLV